MTEKVSTLENARLSGSNYLFVVLNESDYDTEVQKIWGDSLKSLGSISGRRFVCPDLPNMRLLSEC